MSFKCAFVWILSAEGSFFWPKTIFDKEMCASFGVTEGAPLENHQWSVYKVGCICERDGMKQKAVSLWSGGSPAPPLPIESDKKGCSGCVMATRRGVRLHSLIGPPPRSSAFILKPPYCRALNPKHTMMSRAGTGRTQRVQGVWESRSWPRFRNGY